MRLSSRKDGLNSLFKEVRVFKVEAILACRWEGLRLSRSFWKVPGLPTSSLNLPRKFLGDFPVTSLTVDFKSFSAEVPRKFPRLPWKSPRLPRKFPRPTRRSTPHSGKPDITGQTLRMCPKRPFRFRVL